MVTSLKEPGYFEKAPDVQESFRVVTTHHYPWGALMGWLRIKPLTEKWAEGTVDELEIEARKLSHSTPGPIQHPVQIRFEEDLAEWKREQGATLTQAIKRIKTDIERERLEALYPMKSLGDPVI